jgi:two-component sensor histidine kinase
VRDIPDRKRAEEALRESEERIRASLAEKEVLLKEIHHRVKNNMQVISSLVALQADGLQDGTERAALQDVTHRVRAMALVHEKLYQSPDLARVEFAEYARSLLSYLWRAHGTAASGIRLTLDLEPITLSVERAVPCGLILNELVTKNALKHAFRGRDTSENEVSVSLHSRAKGAEPVRKKMAMVLKQSPGITRRLRFREKDCQPLRKVFVILRAQKYLSTLYPADHDVVQNTWCV